MAHAVALNTHTGAIHTPRPDPTRIVGQTAAIAINTALLLLLLAPLSPPPAVAPTREPIIDVFYLPRPKPPVMINFKPDPKPTPPKTVPVVQHPRTATPPVAPVVADSQPGDEVAPPIGPVEVEAPVSIEPPSSSGSHLQAINAPPPSYPPQAVREGLTGVVELEILVGIDGKPLEATVVRSSGHRLLDQAARRIVLSRWTFQPAMRDGQPVQALGRVPIEFKLDH